MTELERNILELAKKSVKPVAIAHKLQCSASSVHNAIRKARDRGDFIPMQRRSTVRNDSYKIRVTPKLYKLLESYAARKETSLTDAASRILEEALLPGGSADV